jgi:hypothetical protein
MFLRDLNCKKNPKHQKYSKTPPKNRVQKTPKNIKKHVKNTKIIVKIPPKTPKNTSKITKTAKNGPKTHCSSPSTTSAFPIVNSNLIQREKMEKMGEKWHFRCF